MKTILSHYTKDQIRKASAIKAIIMDVDGVLTDGRIIYDDAGRELKCFHVKDGIIVGYLKKAGIITGIISGRESAAVSKHCAGLKIDFCHQGILDKLSVVEKLADHYKLRLKQVMFIGADLDGLPVFSKCGLGVCPADAVSYIREAADLVTHTRGGKGVLREAADLVLAAHGELERIANA